uniref:Putative secreted protein n=1 Tax=Ixodes ricinus TaxID=34613 RepID=A0A6B0U7K1_IXORI
MISLSSAFSLLMRARCITPTPSVSQAMKTNLDRLLVSSPNWIRRYTKALAWPSRVFLSVAKSSPTEAVFRCPSSCVKRAQLVVLRSSRTLL